MNNFDIKITKKTILNNCEGGGYYLIQGQIINENKTRFKRFRFVLPIFNNDICDYFEKDTFTKKDKNNYILEQAHLFTDTIENYNNCNTFYKACNDTIEDYNKHGKNVVFMYS